MCIYFLSICIILLTFSNKKNKGVYSDNFIFQPDTFRIPFPRNILSKLFLVFLLLLPSQTVSLILSSIYFKFCMFDIHNTFYFYLSSRFLQYILYVSILLTTSCFQCFEWLPSTQKIRKQWRTQCLFYFWSDLFSTAVLTNVWFITHFGLPSIL